MIIIHRYALIYSIYININTVQRLPTVPEWTHSVPCPGKVLFGPEIQKFAEPYAYACGFIWSIAKNCHYCQLAFKKSQHIHSITITGSTKRLMSTKH